MGGAERISYALEKPTYNKVMRCTTRANAEGPKPRARPFFIVLARDRRGVEEKVAELERMGVPYVVVCGKVFERVLPIHPPLRMTTNSCNLGHTRS